MPTPDDDNLKEYWEDLQVGPVPEPALPNFYGKHPGDLVIGTYKDRVLVRIHPDGTLTYGPDYTPDEAAVEFWTQMCVRRLESEERVMHLGVVESMLIRMGNADLNYENRRRQAQAEGATDHDRFQAEMALRNLEAIVHQTIEFGRGLVARPDPPAPIVPDPDPIIDGPPVDYNSSPIVDPPPTPRPSIRQDAWDIMTNRLEEAAIRRSTEHRLAPGFGNGVGPCVCGAAWDFRQRRCSTRNSG
jgi:hypothetical protein